jgi:hypothetical protein
MNGYVIIYLIGLAVTLAVFYSAVKAYNKDEEGTTEVSRMDKGGIVLLSLIWPLSWIAVAVAALHAVATTEVDDETIS